VSHIQIATDLSTDALDCWPPVAHLVERWQQPVKPGTIAICGAKLMGIDLERVECKVCGKCLEIARGMIEEQR